MLKNENIPITDFGEAPVSLRAPLTDRTNVRAVTGQVRRPMVISDIGTTI